MGKKKNPWKSKVGRDCVSLDTSLARWLGKRLIHLSEHTDGVPQRFIEKGGFEDTDAAHAAWKNDMSGAGYALLAYGKKFDNTDMSEGWMDREAAVAISAMKAMHWVAKWLPSLWD